VIGMAECGFQGTVGEFIDCCDANRIVGVIRERIAPGMLTTHSEVRSWRDGLQKLANSLRINAHNNATIYELGVICELSVGRSRADVVLTGRKADGLAVAIIIELKQWSADGIAPGESTNTLFAHVGGEAHRESSHPLLQAQSYLNAIREIIPQSDLDMGAIAFLPNMNENEVIIGLPSAQVGENMFLKRDIGEFGDFLTETFPQGDSEGQINQTILRNNFPAPRFVYGEEEMEDDHAVIDEEIKHSEIEQFSHFAGFIGSKEEFITLCDRNLIADVIAENMVFNYAETGAEFRSWREGLYRISHVLRGIDVNIGVSCEFAIHSGRIDVLLSGRNAGGDPAVMVVEIKQWSEDGIGEVIDPSHLLALTGQGGMRATKHPLWQAERYLDSLRYYLTYFDENEVDGTAVAFLPNLLSGSVFQTLIPDPSEDGYDSDQVFCDNYDAFRNCLNSHFTSGDNDLRVMHGIAESGRGATRHLMLNINEILSNPRSIVPNQTQQDAIDSISSSLNSEDGKQVIIVCGDPGTGKTIVGIRSLLQMMDLNDDPIFISANTAAANVLKNRIRGKEARVLSGMIRTLQSATGLIKKKGFEPDILILDEAQSIVPNSKMAGPHCTLEEFIDASRTSVFLLDERQMTAHDSYGRVDRIIEAAETSNAEITTFDLTQQFRCGGDSNHLQFIGSLLYGDDEPDAYNFDFRIYDQASEMHECIRNLDSQDDYEAGLVASYCWTFQSRSNPEEIDIILDGGDFRIQWNLPQGGPLRWMGSEDRIERVGYPPEIQGQELTHAGVILGPDLFVNNQGKLDIDPWGHETRESDCIQGRKASEAKRRDFQKLSEEDRNEMMENMKSRIRNQYWVLLSRGSRGCFVYSEDDAVREHFRNALERISE